MRRFFFIIISFLSAPTFACKCDQIKPISQELVANYDVVFFGKIDSVQYANQNGLCVAYFSINDLYKGSVLQNVKVNYDCTSECMVSFEKFDEWIVYAKFKRFDLISVSICGHSRKYFKDPSQDFYFTTSLKTFDQEKQFLKKTLQLHPFAQNNKLNQVQADLKPRNEQPQGIVKLWLLFISFGVMGVVYFISRKKNN